MIKQPTKDQLKNAKGKCYKRAFEYMKKNGNGCLLVHGEIIGKTEKVKGLMFRHAWIEKGDLVIDPSKGITNLDISSKKDYYNYHKVQIKTLQKYTMEKAFQIGLSAGGNYGPWIKNSTKGGEPTK